MQSTPIRHWLCLADWLAGARTLAHVRSLSTIACLICNSWQTALLRVFATTQGYRPVPNSDEITVQKINCLSFVHWNWHHSRRANERTRTTKNGRFSIISVVGFLYHVFRLPIVMFEAKREDAPHNFYLLEVIWMHDYFVFPATRTTFAIHAAAFVTQHANTKGIMYLYVHTISYFERQRTSERYTWMWSTCLEHYSFNENEFDQLIIIIFTNDEFVGLLISVRVWGVRREWAATRAAKFECIITRRQYDTSGRKKAIGWREDLLPAKSLNIIINNGILECATVVCYVRAVHSMCRQGISTGVCARERVLMIIIHHIVCKCSICACASGTLTPSQWTKLSTTFENSPFTIEHLTIIISIISIISILNQRLESARYWMDCLRVLIKYNYSSLLMFRIVKVFEGVSMRSSPNARARATCRMLPANRIVPHFDILHTLEFHRDIIIYIYRVFSS